MNFTPEQVELIVQRVVQHLGTASAAPAQAAANPRPVVASEPRTASGIRIDAQVITHSVLAESTRGSGTVRISPKSILTPSARDYVKQHGITVVREPAAASRSNSIRWQIIVTRSTPQIAAAVDGLSSLGIVGDLRLLGTPAEAAAQATSALCRAEAEQVVVFTEQPELVACLANRNDRIRAAAAADLPAVERIRRHLQSNLLSLDPEGRTVHELTAILKGFRSV